MTRKDYIAFAEQLRRQKPSRDDFRIEDTTDFGPAAHERYAAAMTAWLYAAATIEDVLDSDNPRFDSARFFHACGMTADEAEYAVKTTRYYPSTIW